MIEMWDGTFAGQEPGVREALERGDGWAAFRAMHERLDPVWKEVHRVLVDGGIACINIGDATRTLGSTFALYPNHARTLSRLLEVGFSPLPAILWRKQTNAPNKFMGSGMLPPGAYVTLEHEYILVVRKGDKRVFRPAEAAARRESAYFWEERNTWFSDVWFDLKGTRQGLAEGKLRERSGAFPFELAYRLISMFSVKGDTVLDPFLGTGTTTAAAIAAARNSIGLEIDPALEPLIEAQVKTAVTPGRERIAERIESHIDFVRKRREEKGPFGYRNGRYGFPVVTRQEMDLFLDEPRAVAGTARSGFKVEYSDAPDPRWIQDWDWFFGEGRAEPEPDVEASRNPRRQTLVQLDLLTSLEAEAGPRNQTPP